MPIKVAYDISNLGAYFNRYDAKHGINRVVEEVLDELCNRDDLEVTAVALDAIDLLNDNILSKEVYEAISGSVIAVLPSYGRVIPRVGD